MAFSALLHSVTIRLPDLRRMGKIKPGYLLLLEHRSWHAIVKL